MPPGYRDILPDAKNQRSEHLVSSEDKRQERLENGRHKRKSIKIACQRCKRRKIRCDGQRPECTECASRKHICHYDFDAPENTTRYQALHKMHSELKQMLEQHLDLIGLLRQRPYHEAITILNHIRRDVPAFDILKLFAESDEHLKVATTGRTAIVDSGSRGARAARIEDAADSRPTSVKPIQHLMSMCAAIGSIAPEQPAEGTEKIHHWQHIVRKDDLSRKEPEVSSEQVEETARNLIHEICRM